MFKKLGTSVLATGILLLGASGVAAAEKSEVQLNNAVSASEKHIEKAPADMRKVTVTRYYKNRGDVPIELEYEDENGYKGVLPRVDVQPHDFLGGYIATYKGWLYR
ncbi:hypothetical protein [Bacillus cereus]|uniref:Uncharacterized protein n=1 Tax=Bacillus cereus TaxID=1396 RepID=A0A161RAP1_BACCE|nr:hypothetical protein [Bacillus cereus]KZD27483.1 hypothetical protein B4082_5429 [Bacillus cereus]